MSTLFISSWSSDEEEEELENPHDQYSDSDGDYDLDCFGQPLYPITLVRSYDPGKRMDAEEPVEQSGDLLD